MSVDIKIQIQPKYFTRFKGLREIWMYLNDENG